MRQVVQNLRNGVITVPDVPAPALREGGILVRTLYSIISSGTERSRTRLSRKSLLGKARSRPELVDKVLTSVRRDGLLPTIAKVRDRLDAPKAPGYSLAGQVIAVAGDVSDFRIGDPVACAGEGFASHAEVVFVPQNLAARVPRGVGPEEAAFSTLGAIALHGVRQLDARIGETVVVIGLGPIGQLAWQILAASGVRAVGVDMAPGAVQRAASLGLSHSFLRSDPIEVHVDSLTAGLGADGVLITASAPSSDPVVLAGRVCRDRGTVVILGAVKAEIPRSPYYEKEIQVRLSRSYGPGRYDAAYEERGLDYPVGYVRWTEKRNLQAFLELLAAQQVQVSPLVGARFPVDRAPDAYDTVASDASPGTVISLSYPAASGAGWPGTVVRGQASTKVMVAPRDGAPAPIGRARPVSVGFIGAGHFARSVLLPALRRIGGVHLTGVVTAHSHTADHVGRKFGFQFSATEPEDLLDDPDTQIVFIATRHDMHADLAAAALQRSKAVFVEKPLALDEDSLERVLEAQRQSGAPLCVGFNRRFAPLTQRLIKELPASTPRIIQIRVNAGRLPGDHWLMDPVAGGGCLLGEGCHFVDLAGFLAGAPVKGVVGAGNPSDFSAVIDYDNGSRATILYTSAGDPRLPKERIELFTGGTVASLDDFRSMQILRPARRRPLRVRARGKGHAELVSAFLGAVANSTAPIPLDEIIASHRALFALASAVDST